jgi:hypothetical protein
MRDVPLTPPMINRVVKGSPVLQHMLDTTQTHLVTPGLTNYGSSRAGEWQSLVRSEERSRQHRPREYFSPRSANSSPGKGSSTPRRSPAGNRVAGGRWDLQEGGRKGKAPANSRPARKGRGSRK